jgi:hypothetical protein
MPISAAFRHRAPYGLAFPLAELVFVRDWAEKRGLTMSVLLDQVLDGAEFEELILIRGRGPNRRALTIWRSAASIVAQAAGACPRAFTGVEPALAHFLALLEASAPQRGRFGFLYWLPRLWTLAARVPAKASVNAF